MNKSKRQPPIWRNNSKNSIYSKHEWNNFPREDTIDRRQVFVFPREKPRLSIFLKHRRVSRKVCLSPSCFRSTTLETLCPRVKFQKRRKRLGRGRKKRWLLWTIGKLGRGYWKRRVQCAWPIARRDQVTFTTKSDENKQKQFDCPSLANLMSVGDRCNRRRSLQSLEKRKFQRKGKTLKGTLPFPFR